MTPELPLQPLIEVREAGQVGTPSASTNSGTLTSPKMSTAMIPSASPHQGSEAAQTVGRRKPLSCTSCRQRKIKCDKADPCDPCQKSGMRCIFPNRRVRAPRGSRHALEARDEELLQRIRRLEGMLAKKVDRGPAGPDDGRSGGVLSPTLVTPLRSSGMLGEGTQTGVTVDDHYAAFVKQQGSSSRYLNTEFWSSLSNEFDGLRQLIEGRVDDEDDVDDSTSRSMEAEDSSPNFIFQDPDRFVDSETVYPSDAHSAALFQFYFTNVDPVCKILHRPTVNIYFSNLEALLDPSTRRFKFPSLEAVTFAAYFAAVTSMSPQECLTYLGEEKDILSARYKSTTEAALAQADFLNSLEISTLQALTIYIVSTSQATTMIC
jgi:Fungal Zn(2)-Cys(6) binuclear cluster domain